MFFFFFNQVALECVLVICSVFKALCKLFDKSSITFVIVFPSISDMRGFMTAHGQPDQSRSARYILKDFVSVSARPESELKNDSR